MNNPVTSVNEFTAYTMYGVRVDMSLDQLTETGTDLTLFGGLPAENVMSSVLNDLFLTKVGVGLMCPSIQYVIAGPHDRKSFFLVTFWESAALRERTSFRLDQGPLTPEEKVTSWNRQIDRVLNELEWSDYVYSAPMWHLVLDEM